MADEKPGTSAAPARGAADDRPKPDGKASSPPRPPGSPMRIEKWGR